jgi:hypothetical protein
MHDLWHHDGILFQKYGHRVIYDATKSVLKQKLNMYFIGKQWAWKAVRFVQLVDVQRKLGLVKLRDFD